MKSTTLGLLLSLTALTACAPEPNTRGANDSPAPAAPEARSQPNLLLLIADDMGYTDLGAYGSEIRTPNIDSLADRSIKLTNFHVAPTCAPTRSMLLSGTDNHTAGLGSMFGANMLSGVEGRPGYELYLHERVATLPELLSDASYHTYLAGKWHLGTQPDQTPAARGFESSFVLLPGSWAHFGAPADVYAENGQPLKEDIQNFYSTRNHTDKLIEYIGANHGDGRPFFAFAAYTSPHWPLQAPEDFIDRYAGAYDEGYDVLRRERVASAQALGLVPNVDAEAGFQRIGPAWDELTEEEQRVSAREMELYAAMLENLDFHVGRLIAYLEEIDELENTVILFMSDNGAENDEVRLNPTFIRRWGADWDNRFENLGRPFSFTSYGPGWAQAATAPFNRGKGFINEGGTRVPAFILYGSGINPKGLDKQFLRAMDIAPTFLELAGAEPAAGTYRGREVAEMEGRSFAQILSGNHEPLYAADEAIGSELHGHRALRRGRYKLVWEQAPGNTWWDYPISESWYRWQLYDIEADPSEAHDLSTDNPELVAEMTALWEEYAAAHGVVRDARLIDWELWHPDPAEN